MSSDIEALSDDYDVNYQVFFHHAIATGCVWGLESEEGWATCPSVANEEITVMPLWSQPEYAKLHCVDEWACYEPIPISLEEFLEDWLPGMHDDVMMVGVNWNKDLEGHEVEPLDLAEDFDAAFDSAN